MRDEDDAARILMLPLIAVLAGLAGVFLVIDVAAEFLRAWGVL